MKKTTIFSLFFLSILFVAGCTIMLKEKDFERNDYENSVVISKTGPVTDKLIFIPIEDEEVANALNNNLIDIYLGALSPKQANLLKNNDNYKLIVAPSQPFDITFNLAPSNNEELNPFSIKEIRNAMNNLINREDMIEKIFEGYASVKPTFIFESSPDYKIAEDIIKKYDFSYNPENAKKIIEEQMIKTGATKIGNKWHYNGKPVTLKYSIYSGKDYGEIEEVSDYISKVLEDMGFTIKKIYYDSSTPAEERVLRMDPAELKWNLRTGTGIYFGFSKYQTHDIVNVAPVYNKGAPGTKTENFWVPKNPTLDNIAKKLNDGNYSDEKEWEQLFGKATDILLNESYTVPLVVKQTIFVANSKVKDYYISDFTGLRILQNYREMNIPGKDTLNIGTKETFNLADGLNPNWFAGNIYRMDIRMAVSDFGIWSNPKTLEYEPLRWNYEIVTAGPFDKLDVPTDAIQWNSDTKKWEYVVEGTQATTVVKYDMSKYINTNWHHGVNISWADILYQFAQNRERVYNTKWNEITESLPLSVEPYIAYRIVGHYLEIYVDNWHFSPGEMAYFSSTPVEPWLLHFALNSIVYEDNKLMYRSARNSKFNASVMRLVEEDHIQIVIDKIDSINFEDITPYFTVGDSVYVTKEEFDARKSALKKWAKENGHLIVREGGYYFDSFNQETGVVTLSAFRDPTYPFKKGNFRIE